MTIYREEDLLPLSGIQHFAFCRRQWALIHLEQQWQENLRTVEGSLLHQRAHDASLRERRGDLLILRSLSVVSHTLGLSGQCDVVEFYASSKGVPLHGEEGLWLPFPVEYKRGRPIAHQADELQICAQAMCLEEMYHTAIPEGAIFYLSSHRRQIVELDASLRQLVWETAKELHRIRSTLTVPAARYSPRCNRCSLREYCMPGTKQSARTYCEQLAQEAREVEVL